MNIHTHRIGVVCLGNVPATVAEVIAAHISGYLNLDADVLPPQDAPAYALDRQRLQYNAGLILRKMETAPYASAVDKVIGIVAEDLFIPIFTHVLGEARQGGRVALVSLFRLEEAGAEAVYRPSLGLERAAKIALHELCHLFGLSHCTDNRCLMHFSGDVAQLDRTRFSFCRYCAIFFREAVGRLKTEGNPVNPV